MLWSHRRRTIGFPTSSWSDYYVLVVLLSASLSASAAKLSPNPLFRVPIERRN